MLYSWRLWLSDFPTEDWFWKRLKADFMMRESIQELQELTQAVDSHWVEQQLTDRRAVLDSVWAAIWGDLWCGLTALASVEESEWIFTEPIRSQLIRDQEEAAVSQAEGRLKQQEQEIDDLRRKDTGLEQISQTHTHNN